MVTAVARGTGIGPAIRRRVSVLEHRDFRRLLAGRAASVLGDGLYAVGSMWLVYELTGSTALTGVAGLLSQGPAVLSVFVGPLVDRMYLGRVLVASEFVQAAVVLAVPLAALLGWLHVGVVLAVMPLLALSNLFAGPAQNAAIPRIVPEDSLVRPNSLGGTVTQAVDATARGVAGVVIALFGAVALYVLDAVTFLIAGSAFLTVAIPDRERDPEPLDVNSYVADLREGVAVLAESALGQMVVASLFANVLTGATLAVLPAFAAGIGGPGTYGLLLAGLTVGRVLGAGAATEFERVPMGRLTVAGMALSGVLWVAGTALSGVVATAVLFALSRVPLGVYNVSASAVLQTGVPDEVIGRVSATVGSAASLALPIGLLVGGIAGEWVGSRTVLYASGFGTALTALYWFVIPSLREFGPPSAVESGTFAGA